MKKLLLAVLAEEVYAGRFADYVNHHKNDFIELMIFTTVQSLSDYIKNSIIDILLFDSIISEQIPEDKNIHKIIILSDGERVKEGNDYSVIFKFQSADMIVKEILNDAAEDDKIKKLSIGCIHMQTEFIAVFSPFGGAGVTKFAQDMSNSMGQSKPTLYINLEAFDGFAEFEDEGNAGRKYIRGMSELVFYMKQNKDKLAFKLESVIKKTQNYSMVLPVEDYRDLYSIKYKDMMSLISVLSDEMPYEKVVFDIGYINDVSLKLMNMCDKLIMPKPADTVQQNKYNAFIRLLVREKLDRLKDRIRLVKMYR